MGKAYQPEQRDRVRQLLEAGRDEESIEKETGVSDRTIRRWKSELERTGRIGKPPESRTGRARVLSAEVEAALFDHVRDKPDMSVDDMLWWLHEKYGIVVGTRTIRRVFERKGGDINRFKKSRQSKANTDVSQHDIMTTPISATQPGEISQLSDRHTYTPIADMDLTNSTQAELKLAQAFGHSNTYPPPPTHQEIMADTADEEEAIQLELEQIALQKREVELKLRMKRLQQSKTPGTPSSSRSQPTPAGLSTLYKPGTDNSPSLPKRDSRSKKKIEEARNRTAERQERMLRDLERRSRRRDHLTADWVQSKDIWPLRAQALLADLMHRYACYTFSQNSLDRFQAMYHELYQLVDNSKGDWDPSIHDDLLRERMKRKMTQIRSKMSRTGEIIGHLEQFGGWTRAENYTGQQVRDMDLDETEADLTAHDLQTQVGGANDDNLQYQPVPDPGAQTSQHQSLPYAPTPILHHNSGSQYPLIDGHHNSMLPYGQMTAQQNLGHQDTMGL